MNNQEIINNTKQWVQQIFVNPIAGHDFEHIKRVVHIAKKIQSIEGGCIFTIEMAAWLHDVDDYKVQGTSTHLVKNHLASLPINTDSQNTILQTIQSVGFRGGWGSVPQSIEAKIVQDADRMDAIGAIGIARCFAYGGYKNHALYLPHKASKTYHNMTEYQTESTPSSIHHFYEKLLKLKDLMHTDTAKAMALERHEFMVKFLHQFEREWHQH